MQARGPGVLGAGMGFQFAAGGAVIPFVTLLFRDRGLDFSQISLIFTASSATLLVFPFLWGMLADRYLPLNRLFTLLNLVGAGALALLAGQQGFLGMLIAYTCYFACFNPALYLMNALSFHHLLNPREQFGRVRAWGSLGWIVPFLPISLWLGHKADAQFDFVAYLGMACCLGMAAFSFWLPHTPPGARGAAREQGGSGRLPYGLAIRELLGDRNYLVLLLSAFLMAGSLSLLMYYSPPLLEDVGVPRQWIGPVQAIGVVFEIVLLQWQPALLRRWNYTTVIVAGCVALVARHLLFGWSGNAWVLAGSYLLAGTVIVFYNQGVSVLVNSMAAVEVRATAQTLLLLFGQGLGPLLANLLAGRLASQAGDNVRPVFFFAAILGGVAALVVAARGRQLNAAGSGAARRGG